MTRASSAGAGSPQDEVELEWWHEPEEESQELATPPRGSQAFAADDVIWAEDKQHPDYRHLDAGFADEEFEFTGADLELIIRENRFEPTREEDRILFGLRGAMLASGSSASGASLRLRLTRPDHRDFRCVIGVYNTGTKQVSGFVGSTVPWYSYVHDYFLRGRGEPKTNLMPTGCYPYYIGPHGKHQIPGCLRLGTGHDKTQQERVAVLRTLHDVRYDTTDVFDPSIPHDNLHPSFSGRMFRSRGCQTIRGGYDAGHTGEWAEFRSAVGLGNRGDNGKRFDYVLVTGLEAAIAAKLRGGGQAGNAGVVLERLTRLRHGSRGELVTSLQRKLGLTATGAFGAQETKALATLQRKKFGFADGIYSPDMDARLEFSILKSAPVATPAQVRHIAAGSKRIALVIGNGAYTGASQLENPTRDADAFAEKLKSLDFSVTLLRDASENAMVQSIVKFKDDLTACHVGLIFYAGHGVQIDGENYVLPVDCNPGTMPELRQSSVSLGTLLEPLEESGKVGIIVLDCCRDNPFQGRSVSRSLRRGFANLGAPAGTFIAFSTQPGATASDGQAGQHSPFAASLLQHISAEDQDIGQVMRVVRKEVNEKTEGRQLPWDQSSLMVDHFAFKQTDRNVEHRVLTREELDRQRKETGKQREDEYWTLTSTSNSEQLIESFIAQYPDSRYRSEADAKLREIRFKIEQAKRKARLLRNGLIGMVAAALLIACVAGFYVMQWRELQVWQNRAYDGQFRLLLAKARDKLGADDPDEARSQALAAHRILKEEKKEVKHELRVDFTNIVTESLKHDADVALDQSRGVVPKSTKAAFTPDGKYIVWTSDGRSRHLNISDAQSGRSLVPQLRFAEKVQTLITSPDSSHAALLSEQGDAELFALRSGSFQPDYYDVYAPSNMRAITFGRGGTPPLLAAVDMHGTLYGWRFSPQGTKLGPVARLPAAAPIKDRKNAYAISCFDDLCAWVEPEGNVRAAQLDTQPGGKWRPLRVTQKIERWNPGSQQSSPAESVPPLLLLGKGQLFVYTDAELVLYDASSKDDALELKRSDSWSTPALIAIDIDDQGKLVAQYAPDRTTAAWTVQHAELTGKPGERRFSNLHYRDYDKEILDFNFPTKRVVFAPQRGAGLDVLKRRAEAAGHPEHKCIPSCQSVNWLGASGQMVVGTNRNMVDGIDSGGIFYLLQPGTDDPLARKLNLRNEAADGFRRIWEKQDQGKEQGSQDGDKQRRGTTPVVRYVAHALDAAGEQAVVLMVAPEFAGEVDTTAARADRARSATYFAVIDLKTGKLSADPAPVKTRNAAEPLPQVDFVMTGVFSGELGKDDTGPPVPLQVLVSRGQNGVFAAEHAPPQWQITRTGGTAGLLRRDGSFLRIEHLDAKKAQSPDWLSEIRLASGEVADFGFVDQGKSVFVAYEDGQVELWDLDAKSKEAQPRTIFTRTKLTSAQSLAWSLDQQVLHVRDGSVIKRFAHTGLLVDRYAPGRSVHAMVPLADGALFAVIGTDHAVLPAVGPAVAMEKVPYMAEALTPRLMARSDEQVVANWFLPTEEAPQNDGLHASCAHEDKNYAYGCSILHRYYSTPDQRALAVLEYAYGTLERDSPGRGAAFALVDAGADSPLGLALVAREFGKGASGATSATEGTIGAINCSQDRVAAVRKLYVQSLQSGRFIAPFFAGLELQCGGGVPNPTPMTSQLQGLGDRGDPMALVLLGVEQERTAKDDADEMAKALEHFGVAGRLLLAQRDRLRPKQVFADQRLIESIEQAVNLRRAKLAARLEPLALAKVFEKAEKRVLALQRILAQGGGTGDGPRAVTVKDMLAALEKPGLGASLAKGENRLAELVGKPMLERLLPWVVRANYEMVRRAEGPGTTPDAARAAQLQFLRAAGRLPAGVFAEAIIGLEQALPEQSRAIILTNDKLKELTADFAQLAQLVTDKGQMSAPRRARLFLELSDAAVQAGSEMAAPLAIAALHKSENLPRNKRNADILNEAQTQVLELLGSKSKHQREFALVGWNYLNYANTKVADMSAKDTMQLLDRGLQLHQRYVDTYAPKDLFRQRRLAAAYKASGKHALENNDFDRAAGAYTKVIEITPKDRDGYMQRGTAYEFKRSYELAIADYTEAIKVSPRWDEALRYRGDSYRALGKYKEAVDDYTKAIEIDPSDSNYFGRGRTYLVSADLDNAIKDFSKVVEVRSYDEGFRFRGIAWLLKDEYDKAVDDFTKALKIDPKDDNYYNGRAWAHYKAGRLQDALKDAEKAVSIIRFNPAECADTLGQIHLALGNTAEANKAFARARELKPGLQLTPADTLKRLAP